MVEPVGDGDDDLVAHGRSEQWSRNGVTVGQRVDDPATDVDLGGLRCQTGCHGASAVWAGGFGRGDRGGHRRCRRFGSTAPGQCESARDAGGEEATPAEARRVQRITACRQCRHSTAPRLSRAGRREDDFHPAQVDAIAQPGPAVFLPMGGIQCCHARAPRGVAAFLLTATMLTIASAVMFPFEMRTVVALAENKLVATYYGYAAPSLGWESWSATVRPRSTDGLIDEPGVLLGSD